MKILITLVIGIAIGGLAVWCVGTRQGKQAVHSANDALQDKLKVMDLRSEDIKDELAKTGQVIRRTAKAAGQAIADGTADARTTTAIKAKLVGSKDLSAMSISVNTTAGVVTLSGSVRSTEEVSKAMMLAMETDGVREVVSTLQVAK
jgi:hypothetical protein